MSVFHENMLIGSSGQGGAAAGYQIERSIRLNSADSAYLNRTPGSSGNRKTWTWAGWVKGVVTSENPHLFTCTTGATDATYFRLWFVSDSIRVSNYNNNLRQTSAVYRDPSAWYHIVLAVDTTQATAANRIKLYVNGSEVTAFSSSVNPNQNDDLGINQAAAHSIGATSAGTATLSAYLADIHFIDGQALDPSSFTEVSATTGQLIPKAYTGSFGTNGFWLKFSDNSAATATTLGKDYSGNSNNWTPNNLSVTAGAGNDSLVDTPTSYGTDTGAGGEVRGNYATLNPLHSYVSTASNGNLDCTSNGGGWIGSTIHVTSGKWYVEYTVGATGIIQMFGVCTSTHSGSGYPWLASTPGVTYYVSDGRIYVDGVNTGATTGATNGDIISLSFDVDAKSVVVRKNNSVLSTKTIGTTSSYMFYISDGGGNATSSINFGQRPFAYTAPSGFKALCDTNLPAPVVAKPNTVMDIALYTGTGSARSITLPGGFSPDFVWIKKRNGATSHRLFDAVRGATKNLYSNTTDAEGTDATTLSSFDSTGFALGDNGAVNALNDTYAAWCFDAGSSTVTNTQGSITSSVRANASAGFSIVTYTGTGANATVGHGLGAAPQLIIVKRRDTTGDWATWHTSIANTNYLLLNDTAASTSGTTYWNSTSPTSSLFSVGTATNTNANTGTYVAYCFAPVAGYSAFGSYTGNGTQVFVYTGFKPRWILLKTSGPVGGDWFVYDTARDAYNVSTKTLSPNLSGAEVSSSSNKEIDILSNGFLLRADAAGYNNYSGWNYIYAAFAENPFQYARAR